jgi:hypothetical protein
VGSSCYFVIVNQNAVILDYSTVSALVSEQYGLR